MKMKIKNRSHRYDINRPSWGHGRYDINRYGHKYS